MRSSSRSRWKRSRTERRPWVTVHRALLVLGLLAASAASVAAETFSVDPRHTFASFEVSHLGLSTQRGRFNRARGEIGLDLGARRGWVQIQIDPDSVDTGDAQLEAVLRSETFFDTANHRYIYFRSTGLEFTGNRLSRVRGELTMLDVTRPLELVVTSFHCGPNPVTGQDVCGADATATLRRSDYGMTRHIPAVGDEVRLLIQVEATRN